jgi:hypothetical protein
MNHATDPVGGEPWLAPDMAQGEAAAGEASGLAESSFGGRRWQVPPEVLDAITRRPAPQTVPATDEARAWQAPPEPPAARDPGPGPEADERAARLQAAHAELARDIEGWSPQMAAEITAYGRARGFTAEELAAVEDPREVRLLHAAMVGERALAEQAQAQRFGRFRPPTQVGGRGHPGALPNDRSSTEAWMQARHTQLRKKARR